MLQKFVLFVETLYGKEHMTYNIHQLVHIVQTVRNWGPLWVTSTFTYESHNGTLLKLFHGTQGVPIQIIDNFNVWKHIPMLVSNHMQNSSHRVKLFSDSLLDGYVTTKHAHHVNEAVTVLGCVRKHNTSCRERRALETHLETVVPGMLDFYDCAVVTNMLIQSSSYNRVTRKNSYTVGLKMDHLV